MTVETHIAWVGADGVARGDPLVFPWWSFTKTVIAAAVLRLAEQGQVALDAPLPGQEWTPAHLLQHRAGVPDYGGLPAYHAAVARGKDAWSRAILLARAPQAALFAPGTGWAYSNIGYLFLAELLEEVTGRSLDGALRALVLAPLSVTGPFVGTTRADMARLPWPEQHGYDPGWVYHGCLLGAAPDAALLLHRLMTGGLLRADTLARMQAPHALGGALPGRPWRTHGYGLGLMCGEVAGLGLAVGHSGGGPGSVCAVYHLPGVGVTVASFARGGPEAVAEHAAMSGRAM